MDITLRKAARLQTDIQSAIKDLALGATTDVSIFEPDAMAAVAQARATWDRNVTRAEVLTDILFGIRLKVGNKNHEAGVGEKLTQIARLERRIALMASGLNVSPQESEEVINGRLTRLREKGGDSSSRFAAMAPEAVSVSLFDEAEIDRTKEVQMRFRREKQKLQDELLEINASTRITLDEAAVAALKDEKLL
jgi:hypothetical protein